MAAQTQTATIRTQSAGRQWLVDSFTTPDVTYVVRRVNGRLTCDCPDAFHRAHVKGYQCKHVRAVEEQVFADAARISAIVAAHNPLIRRTA